MEVRALGAADRPWVRERVEKVWGSPTVVSRGRVHRPETLPGLAALRGGGRVGLLTYRVEDRSCEVVTLQAVIEGVGIGSALLEALGREGRARGWQRIWLVTTDDNARAIRFYEARGFRRVAVHRDAVAKSRELKPEIPERARDGTPIRDELEFELALGDPG
ncbi:MAG: GNAT family N-acetyltransferase [Myxococcota bacterium]